eukprot:CAMPEP_0173178670 /NCGR_PEP_ID=MMETSP1141-20130122/5666_1 /TAXON_ID=483371 /ORGANISM="non described non described, Strain CCMP2298" /LENGTH=77 /DNA_ID=CAMNT_0014101189 /DNA_START=992 /DNA_END=1225 /DNA_ORIENTATION=-
MIAAELEFDDSDLLDLDSLRGSVDLDKLYFGGCSSSGSTTEEGDASDYAADITDAANINAADDDADFVLQESTASKR